MGSVVGRRVDVLVWWADERLEQLVANRLLVCFERLHPFAPVAVPVAVRAEQRLVDGGDGTVGQRVGDGRERWPGAAVSGRPVLVDQRRARRERRLPVVRAVGSPL